MIRPLRLWFAWFPAILACSSPAATGSSADASADAPSPWDQDSAADTATASDSAGDATTVTDPWAALPHAGAVDPLIGTGFSVANVGSAIPGPTVPFGLVKCSPDTSNAGGMLGAIHCAGYQHNDPYLHAFSHNHLQGTGAPDYGNVAVLPFATIGPAITSRNGRRSTYSHASEVARAGYYAVTLDGPQARHELTATAHCGVHRTTFLASATGGVLIDLSEAISGGKVTAAQVQIDPATQQVTGTLHNFGDFSNRYGGFDVYFVARFSRPWQAAGTWTTGGLQPGSASASEPQPPEGQDRVNLGMYAQFAGATTQPIELQVCLSYVDAAGALANFQAEVAGKTFDSVRQQAAQGWESELARVDIQGATADEAKIFYSALYRAMSMPTLWSDVDGRYRGFDGGIHQTTGWKYYTDLSLWDTFRTAHPLFALLFPERARDVMRSLQAMAEQKGCLPQWAMGAGDTGSMIGQHALSALADAVAKGIQDFDVKGVYAVARHQLVDAPATTGCGGLDAMAAFDQRGWVAIEDNKSSVALTLEYSYNYSALAVLADAVGLPDEASQWRARAKGYQALFDPETQFFRPRHQDGTWLQPFDSLSWDFGNNYFVEGTAWQWNFFAPHDPQGLMALFPSKAAFVAKLQSFFEQAKAGFKFAVPSSYYYQGNEPDMLASALFLAAAKPELADQWTRWVYDACYTTAADGLVGNDDAGTLSAWAVLAALGLYPRPGDAGWDLVAPRFDHATVHLGAAVLQIDAPGAHDAKKFGSSAKWNGTDLGKRYLLHSQLIKGGTLGFD